VPEVSVLLVGYRTRDEIDTCLRSLDEGAAGLDIEVVLVDNASGDGTVEHVRAQFGSVVVIALEENIGFGRAVNLAASHARGEYLMLLNPDTRVRPGAVRRLRDFARSHPHAGLVGGRTLTDDGTTEPSCCWGRPTLWSTFCFASGLSTAFPGHRWFDPEAMGGWDRDSVREVGVVTGCLVMVHRDVWQALGGFDERFFMYGEDTDLSLRAREAGYRPVITPDAEVVHTIGASSSVPTNRRVMIMRGKVTVFGLHWGTAGARLGTAFLLTGVALRATLARAKQALGRSRTTPQDTWVGTWQRRREWLGGYPPFEAAPASAVQPVR
jgi:N-acetylglucosaminyl-diphospho-decaprenol L-rhamnosyltransferase